MCTLIELEKMKIIDEKMFPDAAVNISPLFKHEKKLKVLLRWPYRTQPYK